MRPKTRQFKHFRRHLPDSPNIQADQPMSEAGRTLLAFHFNKLCRCEARLRTGTDGEAIHDMRTTSRRLRSLTALFAPYYRDTALSAFEKTLRQLAHRLGDLRDLEVMQEKVQYYVTTQPGFIPKGLGDMQREWAVQHQQDTAALLDWLNGNRYGDFTLSFAKFVLATGQQARHPHHAGSQPTLVHQVAPQVIYTQWAKVRAYEPVLTTLPLPRLHSLRIEAKRLRYTLEAFQEVLAPDAQQVIDAATAFQDYLGTLHDCQMTIAIVNNVLSADQDGSYGSKPIRALLAYKASVTTERDRLLDGVPRAWAAFIDPKTRLAIAGSVAVL